MCFSFLFSQRKLRKQSHFLNLLLLLQHLFKESANFLTEIQFLWVSVQSSGFMMVNDRKLCKIFTFLLTHFGEFFFLMWFVPSFVNTYWQTLLKRSLYQFYDLWLHYIPAFVFVLNQLLQRDLSRSNGLA